MTAHRLLSREQCIDLYKEVLADKDVAAMRRLCREDLFFLLMVACNRLDMNHPWLFDRCREVEAEPDGCLDLWAREHYKSTIITFGKTIQDILASHGDGPLPSWGGREVTFGLFSCTRPIAKAFMAQIKNELETNTFLKALFPDVLYEHPHKDSPSWSMDGGLTVRRHGNPKEQTIEAWGLVDGQPTSKHFFICLYDDVVTRESVTSPEMIKKVTEAYQLSDNLGAEGGSKRVIGTRYHQNDTYGWIISEGLMKVRKHAATQDGAYPGAPVFLSAERLAEKRRNQGPYVFACQQLQNPMADNAMGFHPDWISTYHQLNSVAGWNIYMLCDPASKKKKGNDYTVFTVIGLGPDGNTYLLDGVRDRMNLAERTRTCFRLHRKWKPLNTGYEEYGLQADIEHIQETMERENYRFPITSLGGRVAKEDRIRGLIPDFEQKRFWTPSRLTYIDYEGKAQDFMLDFNGEYESFPVSAHDDVLDCIARIKDQTLNATFPKIEQDALSPLLIPSPVVVTGEYNPFDAI